MDFGILQMQEEVVVVQCAVKNYKYTTNKK